MKAMVINRILSLAEDESPFYPLAEANRALVELKRGPVRGAKVLVVE